MTWTVFEHNVGSNETDEDAPGRGGYSIVLVELAENNALDWWEDEYDRDPTRFCSWPEIQSEQVWTVEQRGDPDEARRACGEMELDEGGIGVPMTRLYTWGELRSRLDVRVVAADEVDDAL